MRFDTLLPTTAATAHWPSTCGPLPPPPAPPPPAHHPYALPAAAALEDMAVYLSLDGVSGDEAPPLLWALPGGAVSGAAEPVPLASSCLAAAIGLPAASVSPSALPAHQQHNLVAAPPALSFEHGGPAAATAEGEFQQVVRDRDHDHDHASGAGGTNVAPGIGPWHGWARSRAAPVSVRAATPITAAPPRSATASQPGATSVAPPSVSPSSLTPPNHRTSSSSSPSATMHLAASSTAPSSARAATSASAAADPPPPPPPAFATSAAAHAHGHHHAYPAYAQPNGHHHANGYPHHHHRMDVDPAPRSGPTAAATDPAALDPFPLVNLGAIRTPTSASASGSLRTTTVDAVSLALSHGINLAAEPTTATAAALAPPLPMPLRLPPPPNLGPALALPLPRAIAVHDYGGGPAAAVVARTPPGLGLHGGHVTACATAGELLAKGAVLDELDEVTFVTSCDGTVVSVEGDSPGGAGGGRGWDHAVENALVHPFLDAASPFVLHPMVLGRDVLSFITAPDMRRLFRHMLRIFVAGPKSRLAYQWYSDTPRVERHMQTTLCRLAGPSGAAHHLVWTTRVLSSTPRTRPAPHLALPLVTHPSPLAHAVCTLCKRAQVDLANLTPDQQIDYAACVVTDPQPVYARAGVPVFGHRARCLGMQIVPLARASRLWLTADQLCDAGLVLADVAVHLTLCEVCHLDVLHHMLPMYTLVDAAGEPWAAAAAAATSRA
ncbi:hypothetical protein H9P43_002928 [Blastocladiella emersonii ATCC 22665]|nr:hypothetical protein H9P43_002928 [Blastocladiella emersonii ATCC 22665]